MIVFIFGEISNPQIQCVDKVHISYILKEAVWIVYNSVLPQLIPDGNDDEEDDDNDL